jgi:SH3 domain-containing protein
MLRDITGQTVSFALTRGGERRRLLATGLLALQIGASAAGQTPTPRRLQPVDEAASDPSFLEFRHRLMAALEKRDRTFVESIAAPDIFVSFGPDSGIAEFRRQWNLADPGDPFWPTMQRTLALGGQFRGPRFCAPYVYTAFPDDLDAFDYYAVTTTAAPVRSAPDASASVLETLSYSIVRVLRTRRVGIGWVVVQLNDGRTGYVTSGEVRSPVDYRACFAKVGGAWKLTVFVAGD